MLLRRKAGRQDMQLNKEMCQEVDNPHEHGEKGGQRANV